MHIVERTDAELLADMVDGDRRALEMFHRRHSPWVNARLRRRCADPDIVAEALQDTFLAAWRGASSWDGRGDPAAWLWGIAIRRLIGVLRKRRRWPSVGRFADAAASVDVTTAAADQLLLGVEHGDLAGALGRLSPELRAVVQATIVDGLTTREAAQLLGIPPGTVKTRMMRAKVQLRGAIA